MKQREKTLEEAKEQLQVVNNRLIQRLRLETDKRLPFDQTFQVSLLSVSFVRMLT